MQKQAKVEVKAVLFDLWGTLVYNVPDHIDYAAITEAVGVPSRSLWETWRKYSHAAIIGKIKSSEERAKLVLDDLHRPYDSLPLLLEMDYKGRAENVFFYPNVPEMLSELRQRGFRLGVVSNCNYLTTGVVQRLGLDKMVDCLTLSHDVGYAKPDVAIYDIAARCLKVTPEECFYAGDGGDHEMVGAKEYGFHTAIIEQERGYAYRYPGDYKADFRLAHVADVLDYVFLDDTTSQEKAG